MCWKMKGSLLLFVSAVIALILLAGMYYHMSYENKSLSFVNALVTRKDQSVHEVNTTDDGEQLLIPDEATLQTINNTDLLRLYERYTTSMQYLCRNLQRSGGMYGGGKYPTGKEVCIDKSMKPQKPCIVYSFGSDNDFSFEKEVISFYGCEVKTFDPSLKGRPVDPPQGCSFDPIGISDKDQETKQGWTLKSFSNITKMFKHTESIIDIVKIDVESGEWLAIPEMIRTGSINNVKQLLVEFHFSALDAASRRTRLTLFRDLYNAGFRIFQRERNTACECHMMLDGRMIAPLIEIAFLNIHFINRS